MRQHIFREQAEHAFMLMTEKLEDRYQQVFVRVGMLLILSYFHFLAVVYVVHARLPTHTSLSGFRLVTIDLLKGQFFLQDGCTAVGVHLMRGNYVAMPAPAWTILRASYLLLELMLPSIFVYGFVLMIRANRGEVIRPTPKWVRSAVGIALATLFVFLFLEDFTGRTDFGKLWGYKSIPEQQARALLEAPCGNTP